MPVKMKVARGGMKLTCACSSSYSAPAGRVIYDWRPLMNQIDKESERAPMTRFPGVAPISRAGIKRLIVHPAWLLALFMSWPAASASEIRVYAAASLKEAMDDVARLHATQTGEKVVVSYGGSSAIARQIENGAPADIVISADLDWMDYLEQRKLIDSASRRNLLLNRLVLIAPAAQAVSLKIEPGFPLAQVLGSDKLAMANPDAVPAGKYGKAALQKMGVWDRVSRQVARADNVRAALVLVSRGEAPLGIVYRTDAMADRKVTIVDTFPADSHAPIVYPVALTQAANRSGNPATAERFLEFLQGAKAQAVWRQYGFQPAPHPGQ